MVIILGDIDDDRVVGDISDVDVSVTVEVVGGADNDDDSSKSVERKTTTSSKTRYCLCKWGAIVCIHDSNKNATLGSVCGRGVVM